MPEIRRYKVTLTTSVEVSTAEDTEHDAAAKAVTVAKDKFKEGYGKLEDVRVERV